MAGQATLTILLQAKDEASKVLKQSQSSFERWSRELKIAGGVAVGAVGAISGAAIKSAMDLEKNFAKIQAATGATGQAFDELKGVYKAAASSVALNSDKVADVVAELNTRLGLTGDALRDTTVKIAEMARMTGADAQKSVVEITKAMNSWGVSVKEMPKFLDMLFVASQQTGIGVDALSQQLNTQGAFLRSVGFNYKEAIALMAGFEKAGIRGEAMMQALAMGARNLAREGKDVNEGFREMIKRIAEATTKEEALNLATEVFGSRGAVILVDAIRSGNFQFEELEKNIENSTGAIDEFSQKTKDPATRFAELTNRIQLTAATLGQALLPALEKMAKMLLPIIEKVASWIEKNPQLTATIMGVVGALGALTLSLGTVRRAIQILAMSIRTTLIGSGIGILIAALGTLTVAFVENWGNIRQHTANALEAMVHAFGWFVEKLRDFARTAFEWMRKPIEGLLSALSHLPGSVGRWSSEALEELRNFGNRLDSWGDGIISKLRNINLQWGQTAQAQSEALRDVRLEMTRYEQSVSNAQQQVAATIPPIEGMTQALTEQAEATKEVTEALDGWRERLESHRRLELMHGREVAEEYLRQKEALENLKQEWARFQEQYSDAARAFQESGLTVDEVLRGWALLSGKAREQIINDLIAQGKSIDDVRYHWDELGIPLKRIIEYYEIVKKKGQETTSALISGLNTLSNKFKDLAEQAAKAWAKITQSVAGIVGGEKPIAATAGGGWVYTPAAYAGAQLSAFKHNMEMLGKAIGEGTLKSIYEGVKAAVAKGGPHAGSAYMEKLYREYGWYERFQYGGIVTRPTLALVGEAGPEAIIPLRRPAVAGVVVNISGTFHVREEADIDRLARELSRRIMREARLRGGV